MALNFKNCKCYTEKYNNFHMNNNRICIHVKFLNIFHTVSVAHS